MEEAVISFKRCWNSDESWICQIKLCPRKGGSLNNC